MQIPSTEPDLQGHRLPGSRPGQCNPTSGNTSALVPTFAMPLSRPPRPPASVSGHLTVAERPRLCPLPDGAPTLTAIACEILERSSHFASRVLNKLLDLTLFVDFLSCSKSRGTHQASDIIPQS
jgi:hypothetical protein